MSPRAPEPTAVDASEPQVCSSGWGDPTMGLLAAFPAGKPACPRVAAAGEDDEPDLLETTIGVERAA